MLDHIDWDDLGDSPVDVNIDLLSYQTVSNIAKAHKVSKTLAYISPFVLTAQLWDHSQHPSSYGHLKVWSRKGSMNFPFPPWDYFSQHAENEDNGTRVRLRLKLETAHQLEEVNFRTGLDISNILHSSFNYFSVVDKASRSLESWWTQRSYQTRSGICCRSTGRFRS